MASFSISVDKAGPTITVTVTPTDYGGATATVQVTRNSDGLAVVTAPPPPPPAPQTYVFPVSHNIEYTVIVTCGGTSNVSVLNIP